MPPFKLPQIQTGGRQSFLDRLRRKRTSGQSAAAISAPASVAALKRATQDIAQAPQTRIPTPAETKVAQAPIQAPTPAPTVMAPVTPSPAPTAPPVAPPAPPPPVFTPTPVDPQVTALRARITGGFQQTEEEKGLRTQLGDILTGAELGQEKIRTQPIATPFLRGQAAALERQTGIKAAPLQRQLGLLQQQRQQEQLSALTELGFKEGDVETQQAQQQEFQKQQQEQSIVDLVNQGTTDAAQIASQLGISPTDVSETLEALGIEKPEPAEDFTLSPGQIRFGPNGEIVATGGPRLRTETEIGKALERQEKDQASRDTQVTTISTINNILSSDSLGRVSGFTRNIPGAGFAGTADVRAQLSQLKALTSLEGRQKLKGSGTISDFEAAMLSNSANALNFAIEDDGTVKMADKDAVQNLKNIRGVLLAKTGEPVTVIATDPQTGESEVFQDVSRQDIENAALQGLLIDYQ